MRRGQVVELPVSDIVLDYSVYPRHRVDDTNVRNLCEAIRAGAVLPPIIGCEDTKRCADGFHRCISYRRVGGEDAIIRVELRKYASDAELFAEAMWFNSRHGNNLSSYDRARCILLARQLGVSDEETAKQLQITLQKLENLVLTRTATAPDSSVMPIKFTGVPTLSGRSLTPAQVAANSGAGGMRVGYYVNQVMNALAGEMLDWGDEDLVLRLVRLHETLGEALSVRREMQSA